MNSNTPSDALIERYRIRIMAAFVDGVSENGGGPANGIDFHLAEFYRAARREEAEQAHKSRGMLKLK